MTSEPELLMGYKPIARFMGMTPRQVSWAAQNGRLPIFYLGEGRKPCARPETLRKWLVDAEQKAAEEREKATVKGRKPAQ
ncbi:hypothetical protein LXM94_01910 [Rhizobium sp. TRM95111]|uniref:hypothetical protein n=1 Tax=Rhizobium alarense TaxID=2846851 RepID=UPI001F4318C5|nr:hypothetical protein [Rhizobium alarense]MCF3638726.1 hypothetical protein [Rhizobium alarense]